MIEAATELLESLGLDEWEVLDESTLLTPNGHVIEWDGVSPDGEASPLMALGLI